MLKTQVYSSVQSCYYDFT